MRDGSMLQGEWGGSEELDWQPLEKILPIELCGPFMWMSDVELVFPPSWLLYEAEAGDDELLRRALTGAIERDEAELDRRVDPGPL